VSRKLISAFAENLPTHTLINLKKNTTPTREFLVPIWFALKSLQKKGRMAANPHGWVILPKNSLTY